MTKATPHHDERSIPAHVRVVGNKRPGPGLLSLSVTNHKWSGINSQFSSLKIDHVTFVTMPDNP